MASSDFRFSPETVNHPNFTHVCTLRSWCNVMSIINTHQLFKISNQKYSFSGPIPDPSLCSQLHSRQYTLCCYLYLQILAAGPPLFGLHLHSHLALCFASTGGWTDWGYSLTEGHSATAQAASVNLQAKVTEWANSTIIISPNTHYTEQ